MQEVDDLDEGFLRLVLTGDVGKGDAGGFFHVDLRVGLADAAEAAEAAAPGLLLMKRIIRMNAPTISAVGRT